MPTDKAWVFWLPIMAWGRSLADHRIMAIIHATHAGPGHQTFHTGLVSTYWPHPLINKWQCEQWRNIAIFPDISSNYITDGQFGDMNTQRVSVESDWRTGWLGGVKPCVLKPTHMHAWNMQHNNDGQEVIWPTCHRSSQFNQARHIKVCITQGTGNVNPYYQLIYMYHFDVGLTLFTSNRFSTQP